MRISTKKLRNTGKKTLTFECAECGIVQKTDKYQEIVIGLKEYVTDCISCGAVILNVTYGYGIKPKPISVIWFAFHPDFEGF